MKKTFLILALAIASTAFSQKLNTKLSFKKGQKLEMITDIKRNAKTDMMGQSMETNMTSTTTEVYDVKDVTPAGAVIEYKVKRLVFTVDGMGQKQSFDSEKDDDRKGQMGKILEKSLKNKFTMTVDPNGKIVDVKKDDDNPNTAGNEADAMSGLIASQLGFNFTVPKPGDMSVFRFLPSKETGKGEMWTDSSSIEGQKRKTVYTVNSFAGNDVLLDYTEDVDVNSTQEVMGTSANIKSTDKTKGQITLDKNSGLLKQKTATVETKGTLEGQGMTIPTTATTTITVTVKES
ncbi:MAG TPA: DUF6263 family protein [Flavisolibacter sp.]|nr:DUF6263 family protein [Flavisolibacter sp.]